MANIINRSVWGIRRHNYLVRHCVQLVAESISTIKSGCPMLVSRFVPQGGVLTSQCFGSVGGSVCITKSFGAPGTPYSYGPLFTTGVFPPKLSCGGGVAVVHSSVVASHGLSLAFGPLNMLQNRLMTKMNCAAIVTIAANVINVCSGSSLV